MESSSAETVSTTIVRFKFSRIRLGQSLVPLAILASVGARYMLGPITIAIAFGLQAAALASFVSARKGFGRQPVQIVGGKIKIGESPLAIVPSDISRWTLAGARARLYGKDASWKLQAHTAEAERLHRLLARVLGKPLALRTRGSRRARTIAVVVALVGVALTALAVVYEVVPLRVGRFLDPSAEGRWLIARGE